MSNPFFKNAVATGLAFMCLAAVADIPAATDPTPRASAGPLAQRTRPAVRQTRPRADRSGRQRVGKASIYASKFDGRKMADGTPMDPQDDNAASKTLPLGSTARVTNLRTGQSAVVIIRDRGPHVPGRIVDLSPATADKVGIDRRQGVAKVAVTPIALPPPVAAADERGAAPGANRAEPVSTAPSAERRRAPASDVRPGHPDRP